MSIQFTHTDNSKVCFEGRGAKRRKVHVRVQMLLCLRLISGTGQEFTLAFASLVIKTDVKEENPAGILPVTQQLCPQVKQTGGGAQGAVKEGMNGLSF